ncbi:MAG: hypothetical protein EXR08_11715 [Alphaproteobacteria bacterium]|nr:hypothetical protein [Alphaproteobacteria bacterium]
MHVIFRRALAGVLLAVLVGCSTDSDIGKAPLVCPTVGVLSDASEMRMFGEGTARDPANLAYMLEFMRANLVECTLEKRVMTASLRFEARAKAGPAAPANSYEYSYFVALLNPAGEVVSKDVLKGSVKFKSGKTESLFAEDYDDIKFTVPEGKDGLGYEILIGFQLSREQLELNRASHAAPVPGPALIMQK